MKEIAFVWPIVAGKEEEWRRFLQELEGSRSDDFGRMKRHLGIDAIQIWLQRTRYGELAIFRMEVYDAAEAILVFADSRETFEKWLKHKVEEFHGVDVARAESNTASELVFLADSETKKA